MNNKERNLIIGVVTIVIVALFWFVGYKPITNDIALAKSDIDTLNTELNVLSTEYLKKGSYLEEIEIINNYIDAVDESFPAFTTQEMVIHTILEIEDDIESLSVPGYSIDMPVIILSDGEYKDEETNEMKFRENLMETKASFVLDMTYEDMKKMLAYIREYDFKLSIEGMKLSSDLVENVIKTSFTLNFYALVSEDRPFIPEDYFGPFEPKEDAIFNPYDSYGSSFDAGIADDEKPEEEDDFVLNLTSIYADRSTIIMYKKDDTEGNTYLYTDNSQLEPLEIVFAQSGSTYQYKYKTSTESYPLDYGVWNTFIPGDMIDLGVYSESRALGEDYSGVNVTIINNTDLPVKIDVIADDLVSPRFNIISQTGLITESRKAN